MSKNKAVETAAKLVKFINLTERKYALYNRHEIMEILDISESTFYRYYNRLQEVAEIPLYYDKEKEGYKIRGDYHLKPPKFSTSELLALIFSANVILQNKNFPYYQEINLALAKLVATLPDKANKLLPLLNDRISFNLSPVIDYAEYSDSFYELNQAIQDEYNVWVKYYSKSSDELSERILSPYALTFDNGIMYLIAYCHLRGEVRIFRVNRIREFKKTNDNFKYPDDFSIKEYLGSAWGVERREEEIEVEIIFRGDAIDWVKEHQYHPSQEIKEVEAGVVMSFTTCSINEVVKWVMGFGSEAEVLEPKFLRDKVKDEVRKMSEVYDG